MINVTSISNVGGASQYYTKDNFYSNEEKLGPSEWYGKGAEYIGLIGDNKIDPLYEFSNEKKVESSTFEKVLLGKIHPDFQLRNEEKLSKREQIAATDLTFNAPKSVSIAALIGNNEEIVSAFKESVKETLDYAEQNYASVYLNRKDETGIKKTGNITAALFVHNTSRAGDPHLHVHALVANQTYIESENKWLSLNNSALYEKRYELTFIQQRIFEGKLNKLGIATERSNDGRFEIKGISRELIDVFSKRSQDIKSVTNESSDYKEKSIAALNTRDSKIKLSQSELEGKWSKELEGTNRSKELLTYKTEKNITINKPIGTYFKGAVKILENSSNTFSKLDLYQKAQQISPQPISLKEFDKHLERHVKSNSIIPHQQDPSQCPSSYKMAQVSARAKRDFAHHVG